MLVRSDQIVTFYVFYIFFITLSKTLMAMGVRLMGVYFAATGLGNKVAGLIGESASEFGEYSVFLGILIFTSAIGIVFILALFLVISTPGRSDIVKLLSEYPDLDVNKRTLNGMTPVHLAVLRNEAESVYLLGETGRVDWNIRNIFPFTSNFKFDQFIDKIGGSVLYWAIAASRGEY